MNIDVLPIVEPDVDYTEILPLQQKRTIAFINNFVMNTVSYLNSFCQSCESRLMQFEYKLQKIEASLLILESQLSSIAGLENKTTAPQQQNFDLPEVVAVEEKQESVAAVAAATKEGPRACEDERFIRFFKMVQFGVPLAAVKQKMATEGLDGSVLDQPNEVIPGYSLEKAKNNPSTNSSS